MRRSILLVRLVFLAGCATGDSPEEPSHEDAITQVVLGLIALEARDRDPSFVIDPASTCGLSR